MRLSLIAAIGKNKEIGYQGSLPWKLPSDLAHFRSLTTGHTLVMGRKTYESIGHPLPHRTNVVLSTNPDYSAGGCLIAHSLPHALKLAPINETELFIIGGGQLFAVALPLAVRMYITEVYYVGPADVYFPEFVASQWLIVSRENPPSQTETNLAFNL